MRRLVVDASALVELLLRTPLGAEVEAVVTAPGADLHTPALCDVEVAAALRRALISSRLTSTRAAEALSHLADLPLDRHGHQALLDRILELRGFISAYDAAYVALAEGLDAALVTTDRRLRRAVAHRLSVKLA